MEELIESCGTHKTCVIKFSVGTKLLEFYCLNLLQCFKICISKWGWKRILQNLSGSYNEFYVTFVTEKSNVVNLHSFFLGDIPVAFLKSVQMAKETREYWAWHKNTAQSREEFQN